MHVNQLNGNFTGAADFQGVEMFASTASVLLLFPTMTTPKASCSHRGSRHPVQFRDDLFPLASGLLTHNTQNHIQACETLEYMMDNTAPCKATFSIRMLQKSHFGDNSHCTILSLIFLPLTKAPYQSQIGFQRQSPIPICELFTDPIADMLQIQTDTANQSRPDVLVKWKLV